MVTVTVMPLYWDSRVIPGCQEFCRNLQVAKLKFSHMLINRGRNRAKVVLSCKSLPIKYCNDSYSCSSRLVLLSTESKHKVLLF